MEKHALWAPNTENSEKAKLCTLMYTPVAFSEFSYYLPHISCFSRALWIVKKWFLLNLEMALSVLFFTVFVRQLYGHLIQKIQKKLSHVPLCTPLSLFLNFLYYLPHISCFSRALWIVKK